MAFPIPPPVDPMLATLAREIPQGEGWLYEPKWDGFRAIVFRDGGSVHIGSRNELPLERYFPDVVEIALGGLPARCVLDGEIVVATDRGLDFEALQLRLHPAASRVAKLAGEIPAALVLFDLLADDEDRRASPFAERRARLERLVPATPAVFVTPQTADADVAARWFDEFEGAGLDGVVAKRADQPYVEGKRVMVKVKHERTADCVVAGFRLSKDKTGVGSLILGVYADDGAMIHIGNVSSFKASERVRLLEQLRPLEGESLFGEWGPGGPSRWSRNRDTSWTPVRPELVCEVAYDHLQGHRFRHGAVFKRWRPDKDPKDCTMEQFTPPKPFSLERIRAL